MGIWLEL